jgi:hypothetical protein
MNRSLKLLATSIATSSLILLSACAKQQSTENVNQNSSSEDIISLGIPSGFEDKHPVLWPDDRDFNPRDFNGIWTRGSAGGGLAGEHTCIEAWTHGGPCGDRGFSKDWPKFTPEGQAAFDANKPSYGHPLGSEKAAAATDEHIGRRRAVEGGKSNDPQKACNPVGIVRSILYPAEFEFVVLEDRILQHFSQTNDWRTIWMDGRKLPAYDDLNQLLWFGYSTGRWEGNTLVVETIGQDDRIWLDHFGYPISDEAHLEERWTRTKHSVIELEMVLKDPRYYAETWVGQKKKWLWRPQDYFTNSTWGGMYYDDCAPADEVDVFQSLIVDPAANYDSESPK